MSGVRTSFGQIVKYCDSNERQELDFVLPGLMAGNVGLIVGAGAVGKSFLSMQLALSVAAGAHFIFDEVKTGKVVAVFGEDCPKMLKERQFWINKHHNFNENEQQIIDENLTTISAVGESMALVGRIGNGDFVEAKFAETVKNLATGARLLILDCLVLMSAGNENDNAVMAFFMSILTKIAFETGCAIIILHHTSKGANSGSWEASRGASSITTSARWQANLSLPCDDDKKNLGDLICESLVKFEVVKSNYAPRNASIWLERQKGGVLALAPNFKKVNSQKTYSQAKNGGGYDDPNQY